MHLPNGPSVSSEYVLLIYLIFLLNVVAQGLPPLPSSRTDGALPKLSTSTQGSPTSQSTATNTDSSSITSAASLSSSLPGLSTTSYDGLGSIAPKLSGAYSYPAPSVPPTAKAPYMHKSHLPEGTVFICVGAILGFFGAVLLVWRSLVAWSLHRKVRRSANPNSKKYGRLRKEDKESMLRNAGSPFYSHGPGSTMSMDQLGTSGKTGTKGEIPSSSLFFSPTAGVGHHKPMSRGSGYLPAGYYAAGNAAPGGRPLSMADMAPQSKGYTRASTVGLSPDASPSISPNRGYNVPYGKHAGVSTQGSSSTLNVNAPSKGRAPSVYLDDLFESHQPSQTADGRAAGDRRY